MPGIRARDIDVSWSGQVFAIGMFDEGDSNSEGGLVYQWNGSSWDEFGYQVANRISIGVDNEPWIAQKTSKEVYKYSGGWDVQGFDIEGFGAIDVGVGFMGAAAIISSTESAEFGNAVFWLKNNQWEEVLGMTWPRTITVDQFGKLWIANMQIAVWSFDGFDWIRQPTNATDIAVGTNNNGVDYSWRLNDYGEPFQF